MHVHAWQEASFLAEHYRFAPGPALTLLAHAHEAVQLCLNLGSGGSYHYRRARQGFAAGSLTVINSGEAHSPGYRGEFRVPTAFQMLYFAPQGLHALAQELAGRPVPEPYFAELVLSAQPATRRAVARLNEALAAGAPRLTLETNFLAVQSALLEHHACRRWSPHPPAPDHPAVQRARDYLHAHRTADVTLAELANAACLSEYHLCRLFTQRYGVAPNQYLVQLRLDEAKRLLLQGVPAGRVARQVGFFDGGHLVRHFGRVVGLTPTRYRRRDAPAAE